MKILSDHMTFLGRSDMFLDTNHCL